MKNFGTQQDSLFILLCILLMVAAIYVIHESLKHVEFDWTQTQLESRPEVTEEELENEAGPFRGSQKALSDTGPVIARGIRRTLKTYYQRRVFSGAPPMIPHEVGSEFSPAGHACNSCHEKGGYAEKFDAPVPLTPHPTLIQCRQCHVPQQRSPLFQENTFMAGQPPPLQGAVLPHSPPVIPHDLWFRTRCLACHGGVSAVKEIQTSHPERIGCRQCHWVEPMTSVWLPVGENILHE